MKRCTRCGVLKPLTDFTADRRKLDGHYARCRACFNAATRERMAQQPKRDRSRLVACVDCKAPLFYEGSGRPPKRCEDCRVVEKRRASRETHRRNPRRDYYAERKAEQHARLDAIKVESGCFDCGTKLLPLDFDHRPDEAKFFNVSQHLGCSWERLEAEIAKCDVRCRSCHTRRHVLAGDLLAA